MKIQIKGGRVIDPGSGTDKVQDVFVAAGQVLALGAAPSGFHANRVIDATGMVVCPGLVDLSARLREPGYEYKATLESEMAAAVAGGVTSLVCPPDTDPPLDEPGLVEMLKHRARNLNQAHVYPLGALTQGLKGERITEMAELLDAGCIAFSQADVPLSDNQVLLRAFIKRFGGIEMASEGRAERQHIREVASLCVELPMRVAAPRKTWPTLVEEFLRSGRQRAGEVLRAIHSVDRVLDRSRLRC